MRYVVCSDHTQAFCLSLHACALFSPNEEGEWRVNSLSQSTVAPPPDAQKFASQMVWVLWLWPRCSVLTPLARVPPTHASSPTFVPNRNKASGAEWRINFWLLAAKALASGTFEQFHSMTPLQPCSCQCPIRLPSFGFSAGVLLPVPWVRANCLMAHPSPTWAAMAIHCSTVLLKIVSACLLQSSKVSACVFQQARGKNVARENWIRPTWTVCAFSEFLVAFPAGDDHPVLSDAACRRVGHNTIVRKSRSFDRYIGQFYVVFPQEHVHASSVHNYLTATNARIFFTCSHWTVFAAFHVIACQCFAILCLLLSIWVVNIYHRDSDQPISPSVKKTVHLLAKIFGPKNSFLLGVEPLKTQTRKQNSESEVSGRKEQPPDNKNLQCSARKIHTWQDIARVLDRSFFFVFLAVISVVNASLLITIV